MLTLLEQIDKGTLWPLTGGIHPPQSKQLSNRAAINNLPLAKQFVIPVPTVGENCTLSVSIGDKVTKGQALTKGERHLPCHAPTSGIVTAIRTMPSNHASALPVLSVIIDADGNDACSDDKTQTLSNEYSHQELLDIIRHSGIAGMGGAAFPTHIKLAPSSDIELLIINGVECEPYITSDDRLMREKAESILRGIEIIRKLIDPTRIVIAIEDNKPEAISIMQSALASNTLLSQIARVTQVPTQYPSGGEKQLIQILTGQEVPSGSIPATLGIVVQNVGTAFAIAEAVDESKPLTQRVVTLTGDNFKNPGNYWIPIGTPIEHIIEACGLHDPSHQQFIVGGPMMGHALRDSRAPILKGTNCIIAPSRQEFNGQAEEKSCIRCGECATVCPASLLPQQLFWHAKAEEYDKAASYNLKDCIECGCCSYVCPSDIPLVEYYRIAKSAIKTEEQNKLAAEEAKKRFDARLERLEKEKQAREERSRQAAERRKSSMSSANKDAVAAALARVQAKKAAETQSDSASDTDDKQSKVAAAIARAKAKKAAQTENNQSTTEDASGDKKSQVAAAIARAKAKKVAKATETQVEATLDDVHSDDKKAQIAAAIARAKAKKAAKSSEAQVDVTSDDAPVDDKKAKKAAKASDAQIEVTSDGTPVNDKKAQIAAAVAKAKAKKLAKQKSSETLKDNEKVEIASNSEVDDKKARVAAAVAKAKAKKLARQAAEIKEGQE
ncbi:electron transport complex subunit RsxC [Parashewanella curva]|uniref:Ion-translocating oxidoreductase complex subunit C n=1 Tax=Parashewanella curva TaxID=2338552 RepID=A0A3L8PZA5_9GAMM|nr:electron transport complex subunit RsxC [Parashewanella curva]RLV59858.1 electron transport complex subunit RsxC [Parashewanella curva]